MTNTELNHLIDSITQKLLKELPKIYEYHSVAHTKRVLEKVEIIGLFQNITQREMQLLKIAALFHDIGFLKSHQNHEEISCEIANDYLIDFKLNSKELEQICSMIMATKIPQTPKNHLDEILADADLEYLGTNDFERISGYLFNELKHLNPDLSTKKWLEIQIHFLENHTYFTDYGKKYLCENKHIHLTRLKALYVTI